MNYSLKLYPNGALYKIIDGVAIYANSGEDDDYSSLPKYKDLGQKQYNYDSDYYKIYQKELSKTDGSIILEHHMPSFSNCEYIYPPLFDFQETYSNKNLYDKWTTTLIFSFLISIFDIGLVIFGLLLFKEGEGETK